MKRVGFVVALALFGAGSALADFQAGLTAYNNKDFAAAVSLWKADAVKGDLNSQYNLGVLFEQGVRGYPKDLAAAYGWYRLAASQNVGEAEKALERIKPLMTAGQLETGNNQAIKGLGQWFRRNIGRDEKEYQAAKAALQKERNAKIEIERKAAAARAQQQRAVIAQRNSDGKLADKLQQESRQAAIKAAQEKAEEAKRHAFITQRRKEENARLTALREEKTRQEKVVAARKRLAELQAKQQGGQAQSHMSPTVAAVPVYKQVPAAKQTVEIAPKAAPVSAVTAAPMKAAPAEKKVAVQITNTPTEKTADVIATQPAAKTLAPATEPTKETGTARKPFKATAAPSTAHVASKPVSIQKITLPVMTNGLDVAVLKQIVETANSVSLDTPEALEDIKTGRIDIEALQWSLISAARGKGRAKKMNAILVEKMTVFQITEANRRAAGWINRRQKRQ